MGMSQNSTSSNGAKVMTEREIFWHNFRIFRRHMAGKPVHEVRQSAVALRLGPFGLFMQALPGIIAADLSRRSANSTNS